jgi:YegS/Rv2252/BmrU family lipid kinase
MKEKMAFIINPISGINSKKNLPLLIKKYLDTDKFEPHIFYTERAGHATEIAKQLAVDGFPYIIAVGGDGTVNEIGKGLIHTETCMGIIPSGSGNGLARHLKIPILTKRAIKYINKAKPIYIDYGKANDNIFFSTCGVGFDAHISQQFALTGRRGINTYVEKILLEYLHYKPEFYQLKNNEIDIKEEAFLITFANASQYGNNATIAPQANLQDGLMDVSILSKFPFIFAPELALRLFTKQIDKSYFFTSLQTKEITLIRGNSGSFHFDGEAGTAEKEINIRIIPKGLKVLNIQNSRFKIQDSKLQMY